MARLTSKIVVPLFLASSLAAYLYLFAHDEAKTPKSDRVSTTPPVIAYLPMSSPPDAMTPDGGRYYGPLVNGKLHGKGVIEWEKGDRYEGELRDGQFSGKGKIQSLSYTYEGDFQNGRLAGHGRYVVPGRETYVGQFANNLFNGQGKYEYEGNTYEGAFVNGMFEGLGKFTASDHEYQGTFRNGKFHGQGETKYQDGRKYTGLYADGFFQGKGRFETPHKKIYEGDFDKGEFSGQGAYQGQDGSRYMGTFKNWRFHGPGKFTDAKGDIYEGSFESGQLTGKGVRTSKDGSRYEGGFENWQFHGQGTYRDADGGEYKGGFAYGNFDGKSTYRYAKAQADGRTKDAGIWRYGTLEDKAAEEQTRKNAEAALYSQRALLDRVIAALAPQDPKKIDMYLLAIGGDGTQEVFRREVEFVQKQFDRDFGTQGRSLALFNSRNTVTNVPMATVTSIRESLAAIAKKMDKENDILFLYLTSHGSKNHQFSLNQNGIDLPDIEAKELGKILRELNIRWKVAVISACYSGGFIDPIKDKYTMVMTAARHDRTSFGCADENDFTYFGKAFFHDSLPKAMSFEEAFKNALVLIEKRESEDFMKSGERKSAKDSHSEPQIHRSVLLEQHLKQWRAQFAAPRQHAGKQPPMVSFSNN